MANDALSIEESWNDVLEALRVTVGPDSYQRWFSQTVGLRHEEGSLILGVPNPIHEFWIESNFSAQLKAALTGVYGQDFKVRYEVLKVQKPTEVIEDEEEFTPQVSNDAPIASEVVFGDGSQWKMLNPDFKMENFVVGPGCKFAQAAARAAVEKPGQAFNPLLIHGGVGLGKTHLMQAIGHSFLEHAPGSRVLYLTSEQFANEFIQGIQKGDTERLRKRLRRVDVLLIDDIQFFAGKDATQEEFFHTYNVLFDAKKQIVLASDRPPCEIRELENRLVSRFESGLTTELIPPDGETRIAILRNKMQDMPCKLDEELLIYIARRIRSNVRRLEGALTRLVSYKSLGVDDLDESKAELLLKDIISEEEGRNLSISQIQKHVAEDFDIRLGDMSSRQRPQHIAMPRQVAMYLVRDMLKTPLKEIGRSFGGRDHGTVIHACKAIGQRLEREEDFRHRIARIRAELERLEN